MPELPEVQTTVNGLKKTVVGLKIRSVWTDLAKNTITRRDYKETIKYLPFFKDFKKKVEGQKIISAERQGKNILINLGNKQTILIHMKMTGHLLYGLYKYDQKKNSWTPDEKEKNDALRDPYNRFIHFVAEFENGKHLVFCDTRKFGKVTLLPTNEAKDSKHLSHIGPDPLGKDFSYKIFVERLGKKLNGKIKSVLMDQTIVAGIGNIYSDEALWLAGVHPESVVGKIPAEKMRSIFSAVQKVLKSGIDFGGDSMSDYRQINGQPGNFQNKHNVYRLLHNKCKKSGCKGVIMRKAIGGRSAHYCSIHQKLFK